MTRHLTGSRRSESHSNAIDASELLDENGQVDESKVRSRANLGSAGQRKITDDVCHEIRTRLSDAETSTAVAHDMDMSVGAIRRHGRGDCSCNPDAKPRTYSQSDGWIVPETRPTLEDFDEVDE